MDGDLEPVSNALILTMSELYRAVFIEDPEELNRIEARISSRLANDIVSERTKLIVRSILSEAKEIHELEREET